MSDIIRNNRNCPSEIVNNGNCIHIGEIYREHGVKGEVKIYIYSQSHENFRPGMRVILRNVQHEQLTAKIVTIFPHQKWFICQFSTFHSPEEARPWRKADLYVSRSDLQTLPRGERYLYEIIGFDVVDEQGHCIGQLQGMTDQEHYVVQSPQGQEFLIPSKGGWVKKMNHQDRQLVVSRLDELIFEEK